MKTTKIIIKDNIDSALSNSDGIQLYAVLDKALADGGSVVLSFHDIDIITTSFLNSSFGNLIDNYGIDILSRIKLVDYTSSVATLIKNYIYNIRLLSNC